MKLCFFTMWKFMVIAILMMLINIVLSQPPRLHDMNQSSSYGEIGNPRMVLSLNRKNKTTTDVQQVEQDVSSKTQYKSRSDFYLPAVPSNAQYLLPRNPQHRNFAAQRYEEYPVSSNSFSNVGRSLTSGLENFSNYISSLVNQQRKSVRQTSRQITDALDKLGARLVGLA